MSESDDEFDPPRWAVVLFAGSAAGAAGSWLLDGPAQFTNALVFVTVLTGVYVLYLWGQHRDPPGGNGGGGGNESEDKVEAKKGAGGYA